MFDKRLLEEIGAALREKEETVAVAESVTSGFLQAAFSTTPEASRFFHGGITAYNLGQKSRHLHVNPIHAESCNCVSEKVATDMAAQVCELFGSEWGLAVTGYASKVPEGDHQLFAWFAIAHRQKPVKRGRLESDKEEGEETQLHYVNGLLQALHKQVVTP